LIDSIAVEATRIKHRLKWGLGDSIVYATARREAASVLTESMSWLEEFLKAISYFLNFNAILYGTRNKFSCY
jgi:hypothetical protein